MSEESPSATDGGTAAQRARLEAAVAACRAELAGTSRASAPRKWASLQLRLGEALLELASTYRPDDWPRVFHELHPQARHAFEAVLKESEQLAPLDRATAQMHLGHLVGLERDLDLDQSRGIQLCWEAVGGISREDAPELWGTAQRHLAEALLASARGGAEHDPPEPMKHSLAAALRQRMEAAVQAGRASVLALRAPAALAEANVTLMRALTELGKQGGDIGLLDEAIAIGKAMTARPEPAASIETVVATHTALGNALLARARGSKSESTYHNGAILAYRTALALAYDSTKSFRRLSHAALGAALMLLADSRSKATSRSEAIAGWLAEDLKRVEASGSATDRRTWAVDVLAVVDLLKLNMRTTAAALDLLTTLKAFADRHQETPLWEAWAQAFVGSGHWVRERAQRDRLHGELKACIDAHGTADMRLVWADTVAPMHEDKRPLERQREVLAEIRALADRHAEPLLRIAWANGASRYFVHLLQEDLPATTQVLDDLKAYAAETGDPTVWSIWGRSVCKCLALHRYSDAHLDRARAELAEVKPYVWSRSYLGWPQAAATIHNILLLRKDAMAAGELRAEIKANAEMTGENSAWQPWMTATVKAIKEVRWTDYAAALALLAELKSDSGGTRDYGRRHALADAHALLQDREVKLKHGIVDEVLKPLALAPQATATDDHLRVSRLDASKAPGLETVGRGIHCREMILTGTAIEELPDDLQVTQHLDVSLCRRLKRLPAGLKVGQLTARECTALEALPVGLEVSYLDLTGCTALKALPADLVVRRGRLTLRGCERLTALPAGIGPIAQLDLSGCLNITALPPDLVVTAWIDVGGSGLTALPRSLDGIGIRWRGVPVDERIAFRPETLDVGEILAETNAERRRVMMERFGLDRFMSQADAQVLDEDRDAGGQRRLLRIELAGDEPLVCVSVICPSTHRQFMLRVPPAMTTCRQAVAWTAGFDDPADYQPAVET